MAIKLKFLSIVMKYSVKCIKLSFSLSRHIFLDFSALNPSIVNSLFTRTWWTLIDFSLYTNYSSLYVLIRRLGILWLRSFHYNFSISHHFLRNLPMLSSVAVILSWRAIRRFVWLLLSNDLALFYSFFLNALLDFWLLEYFFFLDLFLMLRSFLVFGFQLAIAHHKLKNDHFLLHSKIFEFFRFVFKVLFLFKDEILEHRFFRV